MKSSLRINTFILLTYITVCATHIGRIRRRVEWRSMPSYDKSAYIAAVQCMTRLPAKISIPESGVVSRLDDFVYTHIVHTTDIHVSGQFLPWHRWFGLLWEAALREECGYEGHLPYWNMLLDVPPNGTWLESPLYSSETGFGGNGYWESIPDNFTFLGFDATPIPLDGHGNVSIARGNDKLKEILPIYVEERTGGGCIQDGPFRDLEIRLGPFNATENNPRCLRRDLVPAYIERIGLHKVLLGIQASETFGDFLNAVEGIHATGHGAIGGILGTMDDQFSSPYEPLFALHHNNVDRVWLKWQLAKPELRFREISGYASTLGNAVVSLEFNMSMAPLAEPRPIRDFMSPARWGYTYDNLQ